METNKQTRDKVHASIIRDVLLDYCSTNSEARRIKAMDFDELVECLEHNIETGLLDFDEYADLLPTEGNKVKNSKHTKGPWVAKGMSVYTKQGAYYIAEIRRTADRQSFAKPTLETRANAALIAAAPEMLEALIKARAKIVEMANQLGRDPNGQFDAIVSDNDTLDALINRARGES